MQTFLFLAKTHALRWYRFLNELGPIRALLILAILGLGFKNGVERFLLGDTELAFVFLALPFIIQYQRKDQQFFKVVQLSHLHFYIPLYLLFCFPAFIGLAYLQEFAYFFIMFLACFGIAFLRKSTFNIDWIFENFGSFLPFKYFEWRAGLRQYGLALIVVFTAGAGLSVFPGAVPIAIFFLTLNTSIFYLFGESKELLVASGNTAQEVLINKLKQHLKLFYLLILPLVLLDLSFHLEYWYVLVYALSISFFANINAVLFKYAAYKPGARFDNNTFLQGIMFVFFLVPFLFPIPIIMMVVNYRKSKSNLAPYF